MLLEEDSREFTTLNTHRGLHRYLCLPYGVSSSPSIFQRTIENILQGIPNVACYLDNICITSETEEIHLETNHFVLKRLNDNLRLKWSKCHFMKNSLDLLGHAVNKEGLKPVAAEVDAVKNARAPTNVSELKSFLGMINFYGKYLENLFSFDTITYIA